MFASVFVMCVVVMQRRGDPRILSIQVKVHLRCGVGAVYMVSVVAFAEYSCGKGRRDIASVFVV